MPRNGSTGRPCRAIAFAVLAGAATLLTACAGDSSPPADAPPNIVLIVGDDHGYPYSGFMGNTIVKTPNLDRLASAGVVFTSAYATAPVCEPSLRSLLTGWPPFSRDATRLFPAGLNRAETLPGLLGRRGYASFQAGKLWLPDYASAGFTEGTKAEPLEGEAMDRFMGGMSGLAVGRTTMKPVLDFVDRHQGTPFFIFFAPMLPHRPWDAPPQLLARYRGLAGELGADTLSYYANISRLDDAVGELVAHLDRTGLRRRTLIVYCSDNGFQQEPHQPFAPATAHAKGGMGELGFRTPLVFNWPGRIPAGVVRHDVVSLLDLFPTLLAYAGVEEPTKRPGIDLRQALETATTVPRTALVGSVMQIRPPNPTASDGPTARAYFVRSTKWHYVQYPDHQIEQLFAADSGPAARDVAAARPNVVRKLRARIDRWKLEVPAGGA